MEFEILIDDQFLNICSSSSLSPVDKKSVLSLINDFEDGKWRSREFHSFIWDNIAETALSYSERQSLISNSHSTLVSAAESLRLTTSDKDIGKGSELAEIVLYGIMKHHFKALPVVPKIFYKQNSQDNAKGADSVHIVLDKNGGFTLWFGEAKFFNDISTARLGQIIESVGKSLSTDKLKRENSIITNVSDIDNLIADQKLIEDIKSALSPKKSIDAIKPKLHIPILILHECEITKNTDVLSEEYKRELIAFHQERAEAYFKSHIKKLSSINLYDKISFHLILFPVPNKETIVNRFLGTVNHYKQEVIND